MGGKKGWVGCRQGNDLAPIAHALAPSAAVPSPAPPPLPPSSALCVLSSPIAFSLKLNDMAWRAACVRGGANRCLCARGRRVRRRVGRRTPLALLLRRSRACGRAASVRVRVGRHAARGRGGKRMGGSGPHFLFATPSLSPAPPDLESPPPPLSPRARVRGKPAGPAMSVLYLETFVESEHKKEGEKQACIRWGRTAPSLCCLR